jgi:hypothetical protein
MQLMPYSVARRYSLAETEDEQRRNHESRSAGCVVYSTADEDLFGVTADAKLPIVLCAGFYYLGMYRVMTGFAD